MMYTGLSNHMSVDQGPNFGGLFVNIGSMSNYNVGKADVEAHSNLGLDERYHHLLRQTFQNIILEHPQTDSKVALAAPVKAMNDTLGPEGLVPSVLVFEEFPKAFTRSETSLERRTSGKDQLFLTQHEKK